VVVSCLSCAGPCQLQGVCVRSIEVNAAVMIWALPILQYELCQESSMVVCCLSCVSVRDGADFKGGGCICVY
jgi:hypothetical protein